MINKALQLIQDEFKLYLAGRDSAAVVLDNIGLLEPSGTSSLTNSIVITLVNVEEEKGLKNSPYAHKFDNKAIYKNPTVFLNLLVLFSCNYADVGYPNALKRLSFIIKFMQSKSYFSFASSPVATEADLNDPEIANLRITAELVTLSFEQINDLWGSLGGRQVPFVMYKIRVVSLTDNTMLRELPLIEEIESLHQDKNRN